MVFRYQDACDDVGSKAVLVIDTLRATSTLAQMLANGASAVLPVADLALAYRFKADDPEIVLAGERDNVPPPGFDGGNSPADYPPEKVQGRRVVMTTTNGTQAITRVKDAPWLGTAALVNARAGAQGQMATGRDGLIVCAGTRGRISLDDVLAAGAVVSYWPQAAWTDAARLAYLTFAHYEGNLSEGLSAADHGRQLQDMGLAEDIAWCAGLNRLSIVPVRQANGWFSAPG